MGALPNTLPTLRKKAPARAVKENQYKRDPNSPSERMRVSDFDGDTGYSPFFHSLWADLPRLTSGNTCTLLIGIAFAKSWGRGAAPKAAKAREGFWDGVEPGKRPEWSLALPLAEWAQLCRCSERQIEREFDGLQKRKLAEVKKAGHGCYSVRLLIRDWEALPDYPRGAVVEMPESEDTPELTDEDESKPGNQRVTGRKPVRLAAGATSRPYQVTAGVREYQARVEGPVDCEVSAVIQAGRFVTVVRFPDDWAQKVAESIKGSNETNELDANLRRGRREDKAKVDHPRAAELCQLFDPFLSKQAVGLLTMDDFSLLKACEAIRDVDHDYAVKFVVQRAANPIKSSRFVPAICVDCYQSWKASKVLTAAGVKKFTQADIDALAEAERKERAARKRK